MGTTIKSPTKISVTRDRHANQMGHVCKLLGWTAERYCWHQYQQYERFAMALNMRYPEIKTWVRYSPVFRGFWNNEWSLRNQVDFLAFAYESKYEKEGLLNEYLFINNVDNLINNEAFMYRFENLLKLI